MRTVYDLSHFEISEIRHFYRLKIKAEVICKRFEIAEEGLREILAEKPVDFDRQHFTQSDYAEIGKMLEQGCSTKEITTRFGMTSDYLHYLNGTRFKVKRKRHDLIISEEQRLEVTKLCREGVSVKELAKKYGISESYVYKLKNNYNENNL